MSDDPIRALLAMVARQPIDMRPGFVSAPFGHVEAHGGDLVDVRAWAEAHGGVVDTPAPHGPRGLRAGQVFAAADVTDRRRFVLPASALAA